MNESDDGEQIIDDENKPRLTKKKPHGASYSDGR